VSFLGIPENRSPVIAPCAKRGVVVDKRVAPLD
jgi:hypothetical protein